MFTSRSPSETQRIGYMCGEKAKAGDIYCLSGELGAGKTVFAKGFARGLGVESEIVSPTFIIANEYTGRAPFFHLDCYRCGPDDIRDIGLDDYLFGGGVTLIEWAELIDYHLPENCVWVKITKDAEDEDVRHINIH